MVKTADISTKRLISLAPENWVKWVTHIPDIVCGEIINSEFQWISRESDVLVRATSPKYGEFLVLNELQLRYKPEIVMAFFATFVLDSAIVQQIMRWDMAVLRESPWYQQIFREGEECGEQRGEQRGRREGWRQGQQEGILSGIELALEIKFGAEGLQLMPEISQISDLDRLKAIQQVIKSVNTLDELRELI